MKREENEEKSNIFIYFNMEGDDIDTNDVNKLSMIGEFVFVRKHENPFNSKDYKPKDYDYCYVMEKYTQLHNQSVEEIINKFFDKYVTNAVSSESLRKYKCSMTASIYPNYVLYNLELSPKLMSMLGSLGIELNIEVSHLQEFYHGKS